MFYASLWFLPLFLVPAWQEQEYQKASGVFTIAQPDVVDVDADTLRRWHRYASLPPNHKPTQLFLGFSDRAFESQSLFPQLTLDAVIDKIEKPGFVKHLALSGFDLQSSNGIIRFDQLQIVQLNDCVISLDAARYFGEIEKVGQIELTRGKISDEAFEKLLVAKAKLRVVAIREHKISDQWFTAISSLTSVEVLDFSGSVISHEQASAFCDLPNLKLLVVRDTMISAAQIEQLSKQHQNVEIIGSK